MKIQIICSALVLSFTIGCTSENRTDTSREVQQSKKVRLYKRFVDWFEREYPDADVPSAYQEILSKNNEYQGFAFLNDYGAEEAFDKLDVPSRYFRIRGRENVTCSVRIDRVTKAGREMLHEEHFTIRVLKEGTRIRDNLFNGSLLLNRPRGVGANVAFTQGVAPGHLDVQWRQVGGKNQVTVDIEEHVPDWVFDDDSTVEDEIHTSEALFAGRAVAWPQTISAWEYRLAGKDSIRVTIGGQLSRYAETLSSETESLDESHSDE